MALNALLCADVPSRNYSLTHTAPFPAVVKVKGQRGSAHPLLQFEPPCNSMRPLTESIKCYFMPK